MSRVGLHGLPIEMQVRKTHGRVGQKIDAKAFVRRAGNIA